jgi:uncharacterized protein YwqG
MTLPEVDSPWKKEIGLGKNQSPVYVELLPGDQMGHRLLGYPSTIQSDVLDNKKTRHLLTIDCDSNTAWEWGDGGALYFTIAEADLAAGRLDRMRMEMQCA